MSALVRLLREEAERGDPHRFYMGPKQRDLLREAAERIEELEGVSGSAKREKEESAE